MTFSIVIPARYDSSRLPGKPLLKETGKYLIQHVWERAIESQARSVIVATDDERIEDIVYSFGGYCLTTSKNHRSGTDRAAEVAKDLSDDIIVVLQGDEPLITVDMLNQLPELMHDRKMATWATPLVDFDAWVNQNVVKVVRDDAEDAMYFSRSPIPHSIAFGKPPGAFLQHVGVYAYRRDFLQLFASQPVHYLEELEQLEQMRALAMGVKIRVPVVMYDGFGIDTPEDYRRFVEVVKHER